MVAGVAESVPCGARPEPWTLQGVERLHDEGVDVRTALPAVVWRAASGVPPSGESRYKSTIHFRNSLSKIFKYTVV